MLARSRKEAETMPRKRTGYDAACYYDGKLLGRCTKADSDAYTPVSYTHLTLPTT